MHQSLKLPTKPFLWEWGQLWDNWDGYGTWSLYLHGTWGWSPSRLQWLKVLSLSLIGIREKRSLIETTCRHQKMGNIEQTIPPISSCLGLNCSSTSLKTFSMQLKPPPPIPSIMHAREAGSFRGSSFSIFCRYNIPHAETMLIIRLTSLMGKLWQAGHSRASRREKSQVAGYRMNEYMDFGYKDLCSLWQELRELLNRLTSRDAHTDKDLQVILNDNRWTAPH